MTTADRRSDADEVLSARRHDPVNHPAHYTAHPSGIECIQVTEHLNFCVGNAIKYLWRAGLKGPDAVEDLRKARWYIDREIKRLGGGESTPALPAEVASFIRDLATNHDHREDAHRHGTSCHVCDAERLCARFGGRS